jgi:hypothetical protein
MLAAERVSSDFGAEPMSLLATTSPSILRTDELPIAHRVVHTAPSAQEIRAAADGTKGPVLGWRVDSDPRVFSIADTVIVGRSLRCDVRLEDTWTSRRHASILRAGDELTLCHDASTNGLSLNGQRVRSRAELHDGDVISVGITELRVVFI